MHFHDNTEKNIKTMSHAVKTSKTKRRKRKEYPVIKIMKFSLYCIHKGSEKHLTTVKKTIIA